MLLCKFKFQIIRRINIDVYIKCPEFENKRFKLRFIFMEYCDYLLKIYSNEKAVPLFNCSGDDFYYKTYEKIMVLKELEFLPSENKLIGHDGTEHLSY